MNKLDKQYTDLLQDILDNGVTKQDRTGTGTISIFARQIRHNMKDGFPLLTTKKMPFKTIATELLWFLRGDTNIKFLVDNNCHIWNGDAAKKYIEKTYTQDWRSKCKDPEKAYKLLVDQFIENIKNSPEFAAEHGELGPIYGKQWRNWGERKHDSISNEYFIGIDQIQNLINDLKTNPDSRRLMVNAWNVGELDQMVLPPCHYGFQVYTRELSRDERIQIYVNQYMGGVGKPAGFEDAKLTTRNIPTRAISLMWNQRSVDTFLGLPFNIASYGLLLEIIAKSVNMVTDELIGNLGDVHLYSNHIEQAKEQIGRELSLEERLLLADKINKEIRQDLYTYSFNNPIYTGGIDQRPDDIERHDLLSDLNIPKRTRQPFPLPKLNINTEWWPTIGGECGIGPLDANAIFEGFKNDNFCRCLLEEDIQLYDYNSHPAIKAPLSN